MTDEAQRTMQMFELCPIPTARRSRESLQLNAAARRILGESPDLLRSLDQQFAALKAGPHQIRVELTRPDASRVSFDVSSARSGEATYFFLLHARTEGFRSGTAMAAPHTMEKLLDQVPLAVMAVSAREGTVFCNRRARDLLGLDLNEPRRAYPIVGPDREVVRRELLPPIRALLGETVHRDDLCVEVRGELTPLEIWAAPVRDPSGEVIFGVGVFADITTRRDAENRLEQARRSLLEAHRRIGQAEMASSVLHNVGNVLNSVNVSLGLAQEKLSDTRVARLGQIVSLLEQNASTLSSFLENDPRGKKVGPYLLALGRELESERVEILEHCNRAQRSLEHILTVVAKQRELANTGESVTRCNLRQLVDDALWMTRSTLDRYQIRVEVEVQAGTPVVFLDRDRVLQVLVNLVLNAKQSVVAAERETRRVQVRAGWTPGEVTLIVEDNGLGISPENRGRIFERGFTTKPDGHGFGLHDSALAASELGGRLSFESRGLGMGARFELRIPARPAPTD